MCNLDREQVGAGIAVAAIVIPMIMMGLMLIGAVVMYRRADKREKWEQARLASRQIT